MAARIVDKQFDVQAGALVVTIEDELGVRSVHTIHVLEPDGREAEVAGHIAQALAAADERAGKVRAVFSRHGWTKG